MAPSSTSTMDSIERLVVTELPVAALSALPITAEASW
jgi:hypothetical protein